ncbi:MAG: GNAT family N-acetyltransferase [Prevotella sp.]|nr:GNAT family N-acetyltransferase [Prevotella sp.]
MKENLDGLKLVPLQEEDRVNFIYDNQRAFKYGALEEFGVRDDHFEDDDEIISSDTIERSIDGEHAETFRIVLNEEIVGGLVLSIDKETQKGELELLFVNPHVHSKGIGQAAWQAVERMHPEIKIWETITPYFEKRNIHFYVNRCGFHIVEYWNKYFHGKSIPNEEEGNWGEDDEMFLFRKTIE